MKRRNVSRVIRWLAFAVVTALLALSITLLNPIDLRRMALLDLQVTSTEITASVTQATSTQPQNTWTPSSSDYTFSPPTITPGPSITPPPTYTPEPFITGIFDGGQIARVNPPYGMSNLWAGIVNGEETLVIAGVKHASEGSDEASQGVVMVEVHSLDRSNADFIIYDAPIADSGILEITSVTDNRLTLQAESGVTLFFDIPTRQFVESLTSTATAPTITPMPPITPSPTNFPPCPIGGPYPPPVCEDFPTSNPYPGVEP